MSLTRMYRAISVLVLAGCGSAPPVTGAVAQLEPWCNPTSWRMAAQTTQHAWLISHDPPHPHPTALIGTAAHDARQPASVIDTSESHVQIASVTGGAIVTRWLATSALEGAAMSNAAVAPSPGAPTDPAVRILVGYRLPTTNGAWLSVEHEGSVNEGLLLAGFVATTVRGVVWKDRPDPPPSKDARQMYGAIRTAPRPDAPIRARVTGAASIELRGDQGAFWEVTARTRYSEVDGFIAKPPPPRPSTGEAECCEGDGVYARPERNDPPPDTCLYSSIGGDVVGMILGPHTAEPKPAAVPGWFWLELPTLWGYATYYYPEAVTSDPAPPADTDPPTSTRRRNNLNTQPAVRR